MNESGGFTCARCGRSGPVRLAAPPFPNEMGRRIESEICADCWEAWKKHQMALINHYALDVRSADARGFLTAAMDAFLFGGDDEAGTGAGAPPGPGTGTGAPPGGGAG